MSDRLSAEIGKNCIYIADLCAYCLACGIALRGDEDVIHHIVSPVHVEYMRTHSSDYEPLRNEFIKKARRTYFCTLCNAHFNTAAEATLHVAGLKHYEAKKRHSRFEGTSIVYQDSIKLDENAWHGIVDDVDCVVCNVECRFTFGHKAMKEHIMNMMKYKVHIDDDNNIYRKVELGCHCLTCNKLVPERSIRHHLASEEHKRIFETYRSALLPQGEVGVAGTQSIDDLYQELVRIGGSITDSLPLAFHSALIDQPSTSGGGYVTELQPMETDVPSTSSQGHTSALPGPSASASTETSHPQPRPSASASIDISHLQTRLSASAGTGTSHPQPRPPGSASTDQSDPQFKPSANAITVPSHPQPRHSASASIDTSHLQTRLSASAGTETSRSQPRPSGSASTDQSDPQSKPSASAITVPSHPQLRPPASASIDTPYLRNLLSASAGSATSRSQPRPSGSASTDQSDPQSKPSASAMTVPSHPQPRPSASASIDTSHLQTRLSASAGTETSRSQPRPSANAITEISHPQPRPSASASTEICDPQPGPSGSASAETCDPQPGPSGSASAETSDPQTGPSGSASTETFDPQPGPSGSASTETFDPQPGPSRCAGTETFEPQPGPSRCAGTETFEPQPGPSRWAGTETFEPQPGTSRGTGAIPKTPRRSKGERKREAMKRAPPESPLGAMINENSLYVLAEEKCIYCNACSNQIRYLTNCVNDHINGKKHRYNVATSASRSAIIRERMPRFTNTHTVEYKIDDEGAEYIVIDNRLCVTLENFLATPTLDADGEPRCYFCRLPEPSDLDNGVCPEHEILMEQSFFCTTQTLEDEFLRQIQPFLYHCGYCGIFIKEYEDMLDHFEYESHKAKKRRLLDSIPNLRNEDDPPGDDNEPDPAP